jgi:hypothetical protein
VEEKGETRTAEAMRRVDGLMSEEDVKRVAAEEVLARRPMARGAARAKDLLAESMAAICAVTDDKKFSE